MRRCHRFPSLLCDWSCASRRLMSSLGSGANQVEKACGVRSVHPSQVAEIAPELRDCPATKSNEHGEARTQLVADIDEKLLWFKSNGIDAIVRASSSSQ